MLIITKKHKMRKVWHYFLTGLRILGCQRSDHVIKCKGYVQQKGYIESTHIHDFF